SFMIAPRPNCFSIVESAASTALLRSATARSAARSSVIAIRSSRSSSIGPCRQRSLSRWLPSGRSGLVRVVLDDWLLLARLADDLHVLRWLRERRETRLGELGLRLLLLFLARSIPRAHRVASASSCRVPTDPSRGLLGDFTAARPARARAQFGHLGGERAGPDRGSDPGHEV